MATSIPTSSPLIALLRTSFPATVADSSSEFASTALAKAVYPTTEYTDADKTEINQWLSTSNHIASTDEDAAKNAERLSSLNTHLSTRTTLLGNKPSIADLAIYSRLAPVIAKWSADERTGEQGYHHIVRFVDFVQNSPTFGLKISEADKVTIDVDEIKSPIKPIDLKAEKERKKKEKEAATAATGSGAETTLPVGQGRKGKKDAGEVVAAAVGASTPGVAQPNQGQPKEKKQKAKKPPAPVVEKPLSPALIDLRVGHILKAERHPNADSLYVSTIACGDAAGTDNTTEYEGQVVRTVCSGLNGLIPLEEMQNRKIIAVCNLKPVTMRGIKSCAMVLAASPRIKEGDDPHAGPVELVNPPEASKAGDRVFFEGWEGEPEAQLNPKKKVWDMCQVGFTTTDDLGVAFDAGAVKEIEGKDGLSPLKTASGFCKVTTLTGATVR
ncbi:hypothetical protein FH972_022468 [Carpinus fangiana]|uniref:tRNA-binding domain-containing protein n=1 Tax=Carpinus fangiana TaxID=176857 RepID=A0A5N6KSW3_9ROSI|nr:hypothetical protein FH972_022468 [Carpinus fangiana]